jgi:hypothetical protein
VKCTKNSAPQKTLHVSSRDAFEKSDLLGVITNFTKSKRPPTIKKLKRPPHYHLVCLVVWCEHQKLGSTKTLHVLESRCIWKIWPAWWDHQMHQANTTPYHKNKKTPSLSFGVFGSRWRAPKLGSHRRHFMSRVKMHLKNVTCLVTSPNAPN